MQRTLSRSLAGILTLAVVCTSVQAADRPAPLENEGLASAEQFSGDSTALRPTPSLFGTREAFSEDNSAFDKWRGAMARAAAEIGPQADCGPVSRNCRLAQWREFVDSLRGRARRHQVEAVNREMNRREHTRDVRNWGVDDYWASPLEFLAKSGDCEDYAIAKYMSLRALGWADSDLRLVVLKDRRLGQMHAVLVVYLDGEALMLDNQYPTVVRTDSIRHYRPLYSINESGWWLHRS